MAFDLGAIIDFKAAGPEIQFRQLGLSDLNDRQVYLDVGACGHFYQALAMAIAAGASNDDVAGLLSGMMLPLVRLMQKTLVDRPSYAIWAMAISPAWPHYIQRWFETQQRDCPEWNRRVREARAAFRAGRPQNSLDQGECAL